MIPVGASMNRGTKERAWVVTDGSVFRDCSVWKEPTVWGKVEVRPHGSCSFKSKHEKTNLKANVEAHLWPHPSSSAVGIIQTCHQHGEHSSGE